MESKDLLVIGGGPGGLTAALRAAESGLDVVLAEKEKIGGVCLNKGCIPSKSLVTAANLAYYPKKSQELGIKAEVEIDYKKIVEWSRSNTDKLISNTEKSLELAGVTVKNTEATLSSPKEARIGDESLNFGKAIIATGSEPTEIPNIPVDHEKVLDSNDFFNLTSLPKDLIIVGAGYIGMELGTICSKLGSNVTIIEMMEQILPNFDRRVIFPISQNAKKMGIDIHLGSKITEIKTEDKVTVIAKDKNSEEISFSGDQCLVSIGRKPNTEGLGLDKTSVELDKKGFIKTDENLRTNEKDIYAIGDVIGGKMLAHKAYRDAVIAVDSILGKTSRHSKIPEVVFTDPQLAKIGEFKEEYNVGRASFKAIGAAYTKNKAEGVVQIAIDDSGIIKAGQIVGPEASEIIHEISLAVQNELSIEGLIRTVHVHPTVSEGILKAAENAGDFSPSSI